MELNKNYSLKEIEINGLVEKDIKDLNTRIYTLDDKVYFFETQNEAELRLYTVINKNSFYI